jgi:glycosyltransferase involved in cell wall biosynthesis
MMSDIRQEYTVNPMYEKKPRVLMAVYNGIEFDGRVQRAAAALSESAQVTVVDFGFGDSGYRDSRYQVLRVSAPRWLRSSTGRLLWFWACLLGLVIRERPAAVYAHDYFLAGVGYLAAKMSAARYVYDAHELIIPHGGHGRLLRERVWYALERSVIGRADLVIAANSERANAMQEHYELTDIPVVIRNIPSPVMCGSSGSGSFAVIPWQKKTYWAVYQGVVSYSRGIEGFVDAAAYLPETVGLVIVGGGPDWAHLDARIHEAGWRDRIWLLPQIPRDELQPLLRNCDVGLVSYPFVGLNNILCAPNKIFEYAQASLAVVATDQTPLAAMIQEYGIGGLIGVSDGPQEIAEAIIDAAVRVDEVAENLKRFLDDHSWTDEADCLRRATSALISGSAVKPMQV